MEERMLYVTTVRIAILTVLICASLPFLPRVRTLHQEFTEERLAKKEQKQYAAVMTDLAMPETVNVYDDSYGELILTLPDGVSGGMVTVENNYVTQTLSVTVPDISDDYFDGNPITGSSDHIDNISYRNDGGVGIIEIAMDQVYEIEDIYEGNKYYFNFLTPQEVYDKVVVIDAGHGGRVPGASKQGIYEKNIDLSIVLYLKEMFDESDEDIGVYYTRTDDSNPTFDQRVQLANKSDADLFISIHNNSLASGRMSSTSGTQVMYDEESEESRALAQICLDEMTSVLDSRKAGTGLVKGDDIYIIRNSEVPVALIEVGFMTNREELDKLNSEEYQREAARAVYQAIHKAFDEGY